MKNLILLAVQGAGKGTVAQALKEKYGYIHISTGDLLRERRKQTDEIGTTIAEAQDSGALVPQEIVLKVLEEKLSESDGYILDGFPRTLEQAKEYDEILKRINKDIGLVINLTVPEDILVERIVNRRTCNECGKIYNLSFSDMKPKSDTHCDDCNGELTLRNDDSNEEAIRTRIRTYHENAESLINFYNEKGILHYVDSIESKHAVPEVEKLIND